MKISILCTDESHPVNSHLTKWAEMKKDSHDVDIYRKKEQLTSGDILFLISCSDFIDRSTRLRFQHTLVIHASDLPEGRGWSPYIWHILEGSEKITVSLLNAEDKIDSGDIWAKIIITINKHALYDEIGNALYTAEISLMDRAIDLIENGATPVPQDTAIEPTYFRKRTPEDSELDPSKTLRDLFDQIRVADPQRYPAFFKLHGNIYTIELKKVTNFAKDSD